MRVGRDIWTKRCRVKYQFLVLGTLLPHDSKWTAVTIPSPILYWSATVTPIFESSRFYLLYSILPHKSDWKLDMISWVILYWSVTACSVFRMQYSTFPHEFDRTVHRILESYFIDQSCTVCSGGRVYSFYSSWTRAIISSNRDWRKQTLHERS